MGSWGDVMGGWGPANSILDRARANCHIAAMDFPARPWPTGSTEQLEPLVRRVLAANPSAFTFTGT